MPRVECATHGVKQLQVPWAEPGSQFTALFERLAIDLLRECSITGYRPVGVPHSGHGYGPGPASTRTTTRCPCRSEHSGRPPLTHTIP